MNNDIHTDLQLYQCLGLTPIPMKPCPKVDCTIIQKRCPLSSLWEPSLVGGDQVMDRFGLLRQCQCFSFIPVSAKTGFKAGAHKCSWMSQAGMRKGIVANVVGNLNSGEAP